jgi:DNA-binding phage protein
MAGPLKLHRSYNFINKHSIIDEIRTAIQDSGEPVEHIAHSAEMCPQTLYAWLSGKTKKPYTASVEKVARALGKRLALVDGELHMGEIIPPAARTPRRHAAWGWRRYQ